MKEIIINENEAHQTVFKYVKKYLNKAPLSLIEKAFRKKDIKINGSWVKKDYVLKTNDILRIYLPDDKIVDLNQKKSFLSTSFPENIVYEDENILIINKKKGLLVHEDKNEKSHTLINEVISYLVSKDSSLLTSTGFIAAPVHRLDRNTMGLIIFAKNIESLQILEDLFKEKEDINKYYLALVLGQLNNEGIINSPLKKDASNGLVKVDKSGKEAITKYKVIKEFKEYSLVEVNLITGRTHQIRVHFSSINHPVIGDSKYGNYQINHEFKKLYKYDSQFLLAYKIEFHQIKGRLSYLSNKTFEIKFNSKEQVILDSLK